MKPTANGSNPLLPNHRSRLDLFPALTAFPVEELTLILAIRSGLLGAEDLVLQVVGKFRHSCDSSNQPGISQLSLAGVGWLRFVEENWTGGQGQSSDPLTFFTFKALAQAFHGMRELGILRFTEGNHKNDGKMAMSQNLGVPQAFDLFPYFLEDFPIVMEKAPCGSPGIFPSLRDRCIETLIRIKGVDFHDLAVVHPDGRGRRVALGLSTSLLTLPWTFLLRKSQKKWKKSRNTPFLVNGNQNGTHWDNQKIHQQSSSPKLRVVLLVTQLPFLQRFNVKHEHLVHLVVVHRASSEQFILLHKGAIFLRGRPPISNDVPRKHHCVVKPRNTFIMVRWFTIVFVASFG
jgi:hypothetical protein